MPIDVQPFLQWAASAPLTDAAATMQLADLAPIIGWAASILSTLIITLCTAAINKKFDESKRESERKAELREREREEEKRWRESVDARLLSQEEWNEDRNNWFAWRKKMQNSFADIDETMRTVLEAQCTQMRSDITHKAHRYMDDLQCASDEEKQSLQAEYDIYCSICKKYGIENHFVEHMVRKVMELPSRSIPSYRDYDRKPDD